MRETKEVEGYFEKLRKEQMKKLMNAGFTKKQAEVLLEIMQTKVLSGGFL